MRTLPLLLVMCLLGFLVSCDSLPFLGPQPSTKHEVDPNLKVAFIGDQGLGEGSEAVLRLIRSEGADMVLHQGDFDYEHNPAAWDAQVSEILGETFPLFASVGNHDIEEDKWATPGGYQQLLRERLAKTDAQCIGDFGVNAACTYRGLFFVLSGVGTLGDDHAAFMQTVLAGTEARWRVCSWHKNQQRMQVGGKRDETGWEVYETCRANGAIIATAHEHSYSRTHLLADFETQTVASTANTLVLEKGRSFAFVSGLGGREVREQKLSGDWWASIYTATQNADHGALFCTFNVNNQPDRAECYFKDIQGRTPDSFTLISEVLASPAPPAPQPPTNPTPDPTPDPDPSPDNTPPIAQAGPDLTVVDDDGNGSETAALDGSASSDSDGEIVSYIWLEDGTVLGEGAQLEFRFEVGSRDVRLRVTDDKGATAEDSVTVTVTQP